MYKILVLPTVNYGSGKDSLWSFDHKRHRQGNGIVRNEMRVAMDKKEIEEDWKTIIRKQYIHV